MTSPKISKSRIKAEALIKNANLFKPSTYASDLKLIEKAKAAGRPAKDLNQGLTLPADLESMRIIK